MRYFTLFFIMCFVFSCGKEKTIQLPEINHSDITEITDVSAAYLFYDETQPDSVELNRKNLISSTNWLVNVDKRLTLKQAIPHIQFLQDKKNNSSHKNEHSKNYFTCHDLSRNNLGFVEFTDTTYKNKRIANITADQNLQDSNNLIIYVESVYNIKINSFLEVASLSNTNIDSLIENITQASKEQTTNLVLCFHNKISFQDYISVKSTLSKLNNDNILISNNEFISD